MKKIKVIMKKIKVISKKRSQISPNVNDAMLENNIRYLKLMSNILG